MGNCKWIIQVCEWANPVVESVLTIMFSNYLTAWIPGSQSCVVPPIYWEENQSPLSSYLTCFLMLWGESLAEGSVSMLYKHLNQGELLVLSLCDLTSGILPTWHLCKFTMRISIQKFFPSIPTTCLKEHLVQYAAGNASILYWVETFNQLVVFLQNSSWYFFPSGHSSTLKKRRHV